MKKHAITVACGDGIGPEIMKASLFVLEQAGAALDCDFVEIGEKVYNKGHETGIEDATWESLRRTRVLYKAPITTPQGGGFKSLNVTIRTAFGLYANVRPVLSYAPFIRTKHPRMDLVIIRENEEDLYTGIEYRQTPDLCHAIKMISRSGSEKIIRYAFEYARLAGRKKVSCFTKDNILKMTDGLFHRVYNEIGEQYPEIEKEHWIIDIGSALLADSPELFDVIVLPNLYGDILSDIAAQISGSVGLAGSANIGRQGALFEAVHGSAPKIANQEIANPSGLLIAGVYLLQHIGQADVATLIHNAWLKTIEEGIHTADIYKEGSSKKKVGTQQFAREVASRLGQKPEQLMAVSYINEQRAPHREYAHSYAKVSRELVGIDLFVYAETSTEKIVEKLQKIPTPLKLLFISNRGVRVWPKGQQEAFCIDQWRCRFVAFDGTRISPDSIIELLQLFLEHNMDLVKTENLYKFDGVPGYS